MNKLVFAIIGLVVLALAAGTLVSNTSDEDTAANANQTGTQTASPTDTNSASEIVVEPSGAHGILDYSSAALAASTTENNLLFFHAAWCTVCNSVERNIEAGSIPDSLSIFKIDYDSDEGQDLAAKYKIPIQYTMVQVDTSGNEITQWVNNFSDGLDDISAKLQTV